MSELPRLLICTFDVIPGPTGSARRLTEYLKGLSDRFQVVVLSAKTPDHSHIERYQGARLLRVPVGTGDLHSKLLAFDRAVRRQLESEDYVLAHFTDPFGGYALCERREEFGFRLLYEAHTFPSRELRYTHPQIEGDRRFLSKVRRQELYCLMNADLVVTGSPTTRRFIHGLGVADGLVRIMRAPVDLEPYKPEAIGLPDGSPMRVLYLGSQVGYQGLPTLLRAMQQATRQTEVRLSLAGPKHPDWQPLLEDLVDELKLAGKVEFHPPSPAEELHRLLGQSDVGVLPLDDVERNRHQGGPLAKASEYFGAGRPVIASDLPVTRELLLEAATLFHAPGDYKALGELLATLAKDPSKRVELGGRGRAEAAAHLDGLVVQKQLLEIYHELLGQQPGARKPEDGHVTQVGTPTSRVLPDAPKEGPKTDPAIPLPEPPAVEITPTGAITSPLAEPMAPADSEAGTQVEIPAVILDAPPEAVPTPGAPPEAAARSNAGPPVLFPIDVEPAAFGPPPGPPVLFPIAPSNASSQPPPGPPVRVPAPPPAEEPVEVSAEDIVDDEAVPLPSRMDPWLAQIAHGYCPPEVTQFARPPPPTTFPGKEEPGEPKPSRSEKP
ncbi:MAG: glycosyltransferase [Myxococcales bacterium]|nr:glycosyltransferase [Myxococcales bacterium]